MKKSEYTPTIGLEIHSQLRTKSKMFCGCQNVSWKIGVEEIEPNSSTCVVCTGQPGSLPVINREAVKMVVKTGLALDCQIAKNSKFDRKNYFYPDLPKGYQISQYDMPICDAGFMIVGDKKIRITRIHLEEDTAKNVHPTDEKYSLIDFNRSGVPLMELVTEPDIKSAEEAKEFCQNLQQILRSLQVSDSNMEKSQMRCEVNISLSNTDKLGTKVEIKNLNSFKAVERSIEYEIIRQSKALEEGKEIMHETRGWNEKKQVTVVQRSKEEAHDYRYFGEPDLPKLEFDNDFIEKIKNELPELPKAKMERFMEQYGFTSGDTKIICSNKALADFTENVMSELRAWLVDLDKIDMEDDKAWDEYKKKMAKLTANWLINKLGGEDVTIESMKITAENFAELIILIYSNKVNSKVAQELLQKMLAKGGDPSSILEDEGLHLLEDVSDLEPIIDKVLAGNAKQVEEFKTGKTTLLKFFLGQVMKESRGKANPKMAEELLLQKLS